MTWIGPSLATSVLVIVWLLVFFSQIVLYTSLTEIIGYSVLWVVSMMAFLRLAQLIRSPYALCCVILAISLLLGLVPYKIRLHDWALFFFESAKDKNVTYYTDPYLNMREIFWDSVFPIAHFVLMYAISWTYRRRSSPQISA